MENKFAPSRVAKIKENKNGKKFFMLGPLYCSFFTSKNGEDFVRFTILPENDDYKKNNETPEVTANNNFNTDDIPF